MPTIDDFVRPPEWVSEFVTDLGKAIRTWGEEHYVPLRQQIDEDWQDHALVKPLLKEVLVGFGLNSAFFPREAGGMDLPEVTTVTNVLSEELARIDSGFAVACLCSVWGLVPIILPPLLDNITSSAPNPRLGGALRSLPVFRTSLRAGTRSSQ